MIIILYLNIQNTLNKIQIGECFEKERKQASDISDYNSSYNRCWMSKLFYLYADEISACS